MEKILKIKEGKYFPNRLIYLCYVLFAMGLYIVTKNTAAGLILILISSFFIFSTYGIQIDPNKKMFRSYVNLSGINLGKWQSLQQYPYITILAKNITKTTYFRSVLSTSDTQKFYDICLLNKTHQIKFTIKRLKTIEAAKKDITFLSKKTFTTIAEYNPPISSETRARRYKHT